MGRLVTWLTSLVSDGGGGGAGRRDPFGRGERVAEAQACQPAHTSLPLSIKICVYTYIYISHISACLYIYIYICIYIYIYIVCVRMWVRAREG
jgi:hypothetical protein